MSLPACNVMFALALSAGAAAASAQCGLTFDATTPLSAHAFTFEGDAFLNPAGRIELTSIDGQTGGAWHPSRASVGSGFETTFTFRISEPTGFGPGDGLAFVIQNDSLNALGGGGSGLGYEGIFSALVVEIDTWNSGWEPTGGVPEVSVQFNGVNHLSPEGNASIGAAPIPLDAGSDETHSITVRYLKNRLTVLFDGDPDPAVEIFGLDLQNTDNGDLTDGGCMWAGFTGAGGGAGNKQEIVDWAFADASSPCEPFAQLTGFVFPPASVTAGDEVVFEFAATGAPPLGYEWELNGHPVANTATIRGATSNRLTISSVGPEHAGEWVYRAFNNCSGVSTGFTLVVAAGCTGDFNHDTFVDDIDFVIFAQAYDLFSCAEPAMPAGCPADLNADGFVDDIDFVLFAQAYDQFACP